MRTKLFPSLFLVVPAYIALAGCTGIGGVAAPSTPPTFVMAWTGQDSRVHTMQSTSGSTWVLPSVAPGPNSTQGVAVAHDGTLGWMVAWNSGGAISFISGIGGLPSATASAGITWESTATTLRTRQVNWTPALAHGNQKWVAVYRAAGGLRIVRSILESVPTTDADEDLMIGGLDASPALAFGAGKFVLAYQDANHRPTLVAVTSQDARSWSRPSTIYSFIREGNSAECTRPSSVTLTFADGVFYAVSRATTVRCDGDTEAGGSNLRVFKSTDGVTWTFLTDGNTSPSLIRDIAGTPGAAFAQCHLVVAYPAANGGANVVVQNGQATPCANPTSFIFGTPQTIGAAPTARLDSVMAVVFGSGGR